MLQAKIEMEPVPFCIHKCSAMDAPSSVEDAQLCATGRIGYLQGETPLERNLSPGDSYPLTAVLLAFIVAVVLNYHHCSRMFKNIQEDLIGVRRRSNAFDDHTANELRASFVLILQLCVCQAILLYLHFRSHFGFEGIISGALGKTVLLTAGLYAFQVSAYFVVGAVFADKEATKLWLRGYNISSSVSSLFLILPTLIAVFYPPLTNAMIITALCLFLGVKMLFIVKGFRIFFDEIYSLLYFILYLCTLEIIPLIVIYAEVQLLCR